jgi:uncharacterized protein (TIGR03066 family)
MKLLRVLVAGVIMGALAASAPAGEKIDPKALLGVREVTKANTSTAKEGMLFEFKTDGVLILTIRQKDKEAKFDMIYKVDGAKLTIESKIPTGGKPRTSTITKLTDKELIWEESNGKTIELTKKK